MTHISSDVARTEFPPIAEAMSWVKKGPTNRDLINMCQAVPSYPPSEKIQAEIARLAMLPTLGGYTDIFGIPELRTKHAAHMAADYHGTIEASQVAITTGCNQSYAATLMTIAQAGDNLILPAPWYFNHSMWLTMLGIEARPVAALSADSNYPKVEEVAARIDSRTRGILLCSPNNPTGAIYPAHIIEAFYDLAAAHNITLIVDETYKDFRPDAPPPHTLFQRAGWDKHLVQLYSFSKIYALAGYRLGSLIGSYKFLHEAAKVLDCMTICPPHITQRAVLFGIDAVEDWKLDKKAVMRGRLGALRAAFKHADLKYELISSGAYFAYVKHPFRNMLSKQVAIKLAQEHDMLCLPGSMFGPRQEDYLRLAFANVEHTVMESLVERLIESQNV